MSAREGFRILPAALVLAGTFGAAAVVSRGAGPLVDRVAAAVDDVAIPETEHRKAMLLSALETVPGESPAAFRRRVLDALIDQKLQYREALRFGPPAPEPSAVDAALKRLRDRLVAEGKNPDEEFRRAGLTPDEVRAALERQIVVQNYLQERFRPIAFADEERARQEYETFYLPERKAAGAAAQLFEAVAEDMRRNAQQRLFNDEAEKWMKEIRQKARITIYPDDPPPVVSRTPIPLAGTPVKPAG